MQLSYDRLNHVTFSITYEQAEAGRSKEMEQRAELKELHALYLSQQEELHDMRQRLARFATKGAPVLIPKEVRIVRMQREKYYPTRFLKFSFKHVMEHVVRIPHMCLVSLLRS